MSRLPTYRYFSVTNLEEEKKKFLGEDTYCPNFTYASDTLPQRLQTLEEPQTASVTTQVYKYGRLLQEQNNPNNLLEFRSHNKRAFGEPRFDFFVAIMQTLYRKAAEQSESTKKLFTEATALLSQNYDQISLDMAEFIPDEQMFHRLQSYFMTYAPLLFEPNELSLEESLSLALQHTGLHGQGWRVVMIDSSSHAHVNKQEKTIVVGNMYKIRKNNSVRFITAHEIYGHANRQGKFKIKDAEGFAVLLEQLLASRFKFRRSFRYLAASLGWGLDGSPMDFRQVFEILWRFIAIVGEKEEAIAKDIAFNECARVFRGGRPDTPGAVYLKDIVYFQGNLLVWQAMISKHLDYDGFVAIIEGRERLLT